MWWCGLAYMSSWLMWLSDFSYHPSCGIDVRNNFYKSNIWWQKRFGIYRIWFLIQDVYEVRQQATSTVTPTNKYLLKFNNRNTRKRCEICSNVAIKTSERRNWRCSNVFIDDFERISHTFIWCFYCWLWIDKCLLEPMGI